MPEKTERKVKYLNSERERGPVPPEIPEESRGVILEYAKTLRNLESMDKWVDWIEGQKNTRIAIRANMAMALINQKQGQDPRGYIESALRVAKNRTEEYISPDEGYSSIIEKEAEMGLCDWASAHLSLLKNDAYRIKSYGDIIQAKVKAGLDIEEDVTGVRALSETFDPEKQQRQIQDACLDFVYAHRVQEALTLLQKVTHEEERKRCLKIIIYRSAQEKLWEDATIALRQVTDVAAQVELLSYISTEKTKAGLDAVQEMDHATVLAVQLSKENNPELDFAKRSALQSVAEAYAELGNFERADYFMNLLDRPDCYETVASQKAEHGFFQEAKETFARVKQQDGYNPHNPQTKMKNGFTNIAVAEVKAGREEDAFQTVEEIRDRCQKLFAYLFIAEAQYDQGKDFSRALEAAYAQTQYVAEHTTLYPDVIRHIAITEAHVGRSQKALALLTRELWEGNKDKNEYPRAITTVLEIASSHIADKLNSGREAIATIAPDQMAIFVRRALFDENLNFLKDIGQVLNLEQKQQVVKILEEPDRTTVRRLFNFGKSELVDVIPGSRTNIHSELLRDVADFGKMSKDELKAQEYWRREFQIIIDTFATLPPDMSKRILLHAIQAFPGGVDHPALPRLLETLVKRKMEKGNEIILNVALDENCPRHLAWYLFAKLEQFGYIAPGCFTYLKESRLLRQPKDSAEKIAFEKADLALLRFIRERLHVNPDVATLKMIRESAWTDQSGQVIDVYAEPERIIQAMQEWKKEFEAIEGRDKLIEYLASDKQKATLYYLLHCGQYRFAAVNSYTPEKFFAMLKYLNDLEYCDRVDSYFVEALLTHGGYEKTEAESLLEKLRAGKWPLEGNSAWTVRLDVSDTHALENLRLEASRLFGSEQLGTLVKSVAYQQALGGVNNKRFNRAFARSSDLERMKTTVMGVEKQHPDFVDDTKGKLARSWERLVDQQIVPPLDVVFSGAEYAINFDVVAKQLEQYRKATLQSLRQLKKGKGADTTQVVGQIELLEGASLSQVVSFAIEQALSESGFSSPSESIMSEWQSHVQGVFDKYGALRQQDASKSTKQEKMVTLRYLDKEKDLAAAVHFADAASSCFTSDNNFNLNDIEQSRARFVAFLYKNPFSHIFLVEDNAPDAAQRNAIGFVFGSFGLNKDGEPIDLYNGVYLQTGKTDVGVQSLLSAVERNFVQALRLSEMFVATRHGGTAKLTAEFHNNSREVSRFCGLQYKNGRSISYIYDDLNLKDGKDYTKTDDLLWHKRTRARVVPKKKLRISFSPVVKFVKGLFTSKLDD